MGKRTSCKKIWRRRSLLGGGSSQYKGTVVGVTGVFKEEKEAVQWGASVNRRRVWDEMRSEGRQGPVWRGEGGLGGCGEEFDFILKIIGSH